MANQTTPFPVTQRDITQLRQTASDAAADLTSTAAAHADKAKGQLRDLAGHAQEEGREQFNQVKEQFGNVARSLVAFIAERPLTSLGVAFAVGFLFGLSRRRAAKS